MPPVIRIFPGLAYPTPYAISHGLDLHEDWKTCCWWFRTPGVDQSCAAFCAMNGNPLYSGTVNSKRYGVRPALWVVAPGRSQTLSDPQE